MERVSDRTSTFFFCLKNYCNAIFIFIFIWDHELHYSDYLYCNNHSFLQRRYSSCIVYRPFLQLFPAQPFSSCTCTSLPQQHIVCRHWSLANSQPRQAPIPHLASSASICCSCSCSSPNIQKLRVSLHKNAYANIQSTMQSKCTRNA